MQQLAGILKEDRLNATGAIMDHYVLPQFTENGKYDTNSSQRILIIKNHIDEPLIVAKDALNKWKEINNYLKQFEDGHKWILRGISMGYREPEALEIAKELKKLYPSGEIKKWNKDNIYFIFPLLDISSSQLNETMSVDPQGKLQGIPDIDDEEIENAVKLQSLGFDIQPIDPDEKLFYLKKPDGTVSVASKNKQKILNLKKQYPKNWGQAVLKYDNQW